MKKTWVAVSLMGIVLISGCQPKMEVQPKEKTFRPSKFYEDKNASRAQIPGTVARGSISKGKPLITTELIKRGQERFMIYCSVCHGADGYGQGMVVQRGFSAPPSFHSDDLRKKPMKHFVKVISEGYGAMYSYADRVDAKDAWAIAAYIRALQLSQNARLEDLPARDRSQFNE